MQLSYCPKECTFFFLSWFSDIKIGLVNGGYQEPEKKAGWVQSGIPDFPMVITELSST